MSTDSTTAEHSGDKPHKRPRLKLIDMYTNRGAFSGDELQSIAARVREITVPTSSTQDLPDTTELPLSGEPWGESSGESSGELPGELSGESLDLKSTYHIQSNAGTAPTFYEELTASPTAPAIHRPQHSPNGISPIPSDDSPDSSPDDSPHDSFDNQHTIPLTENQAILYFCLKQLNGVATNLTRIAQATNISEHTLKSCLKKLRHEGLIQHSGRQQFKGLTGFSAVALQRNIALQGDKSRLTRKLQQIDYSTLTLTSGLTPLNADASGNSHHPTIHPMAHPTIHPMAHPTIHPEESSFCSSSTKLQLQDLILEDTFQDLDPRSLASYLDQFDTTEELQNFLDMANSCIAAAKEGRGRPIQNPYGFLFAQLRVGYINPPEGFRTRKVRAQEMRNKQLEEELAALQRLKEHEQALQFELFQAQLSPQDIERLEQEAQARVRQDRNPLGSREFHLRIQKDAILREWFAEKQKI